MLFFSYLLVRLTSFFINNKIIRLQKLKQKPLLEKKKKRHIRYWNWLIGNLTVSLLINMK